MDHNARQTAHSPVEASVVTSNMAATAIASDVITLRGVGYNAINDVVITFPSRAAPCSARGILLRRQVVVVRTAVDL